MNAKIRELADRVAASHGLDVVDVELEGGGGRHRTLRVFLERNAEGRAALEVRLRELREEETAQENMPDDGVVALDMVAAGEAAGMTEDEDELTYLRNVPQGVPVAQLSGVTHGDCERFSRDFGVGLDVEDLVGGAEYVLEVSSPGLDRRLTRREEFERFAGQLCRIQTFAPVGGTRQLRGRLSALEGDVLTLTPAAEKKRSGKKKDGAAAMQRVEIAFGNIEKAQLVPEF